MLSDDFGNSVRPAHTCGCTGSAVATWTCCSHDFAHTFLCKNILPMVMESKGPQTPQSLLTFNSLLLRYIIVQLKVTLSYKQPALSDHIQANFERTGCASRVCCRYMKLEVPVSPRSAPFAPSDVDIPHTQRVALLFHVINTGCS